MNKQDLKFILSLSGLVFSTSFFLLSCMGSGGVKKAEVVVIEKKLKEIANNEVDIDQKNEEVLIDNQTLKHYTPTFEKTIHGTKVNVSLTGNYHEILKFPNKERPLEIKEVYSGIVTYDKYDSLKIIPYHQNDSIWIFNRVKNEIEFYDNGKFLKKYSFDQNNPYLKSKNRVKILNHYSDAEGLDILLDEAERKNHTIDTYHLRQNVQNHGPFTSINYWKNEIGKGWIVNSFTTIVLLDSIGNTIFREEYDNKMSSPAISPDGIYVMVAFSGEETVNNAGFKSHPDGFELWQTTPKEILHREENTDPFFWVSNPNFSLINNAIGVSFSNSNSNNSKFRENPLNVASINFHFRMEDAKLYKYEVQISTIIDNEEYFKKNKKFKPWVSVSKDLIFEEKNLNHDK